MAEGSKKRGESEEVGAGRCQGRSCQTLCTKGRILAFAVSKVGAMEGSEQRTDMT